MFPRTPGTEDRNVTGGPNTGVLNAKVVWSGLWLVLMAAALILRPLLPVDETRYLAVAWEMWLRGDFLVPHLNGETYSHKPPLLFWLMQAGWSVFGVNDWWPRMVAPLFGLGSLFLTAALARRLWPERPDIPDHAPLLLLGALFWAIFTTLTMFDMMLALLALAGLLGIVIAWQGRLARGMGILTLAIGIGVLAKGPAILLHLLPVALLAPVWGPALGSSPAKPSWVRWYVGVLASVLGGAAIGLAWAIPAAERGGPAYAEAIFWGQSAGRVVNSFAHGRPWWWYLAALPVMILPLLLWPALWRVLRRGRSLLGSGPGRFCLSWFLPAFLVFSAISGKQPHYLLPEFPALALLAAALLSSEETATRRDLLPPLAFFGLIGLAALVLPILPVSLPERLNALAPAWGGLLLAAAIGIWITARPGVSAAVRALAGGTVAAVVTVHLIAHPLLSAAHDVGPAARRLSEWQAAGHPLAHIGKYHGQFQFPGRLTAPIDAIEIQDAADWLAAHPDGKVVTYTRNPADSEGADLIIPFRGKWIEVWDATKAAEDLSVLNRD